jgi:ABC-type transport system substrate-binding protein
MRYLVGVLAFTGALMVLTAACGDDDGGGGGGDGAQGGGDGSVPGVVDEGLGAHSDITIPAGDPQPGGSIIYGVEAETDGWNPTKSRWALSGTLIAGAIYDPLAAFDAQGQAQPYLAESFEASDDFMTWTITLRDGVTFHDGTPLTADVVADLLNAHRDSGLTGPAVRPLEEAVAEGDLTVRVEFNTPWVVFPTVLVAQGGVVPHPSVLTDPEAAQEPIGTGPFVLDEWVPNDHLTVSRNPDYWQEGLPYLEEIEFRPIEDFTSRASSLRAGDIDIMHTSDEASIVAFREEAANGDYQIVEDRGETEELLVQLNTAEPPLDDIRVRRALALATDRRVAADVFETGVYETATGPYQPGSPWYAEVDYPEFDLEAAAALIEEYESETGEQVEIEFRAAGVSNIEILSAIDQMWRQAGVDTQLETIDQATLIIDALSGAYDAQLWRQHSSPDPDGEWHWWHGINAAPIGEIALNFTRNNDPKLNAALDEGRSNPDPEARQAAYAEMQAQFAENLPILWLYHALVVIVADNEVHGIANGPLPDGQESLPLGGSFTGVHRFQQVWVEQ